MTGWERPLDLLEAAYRVDGSDDDWMRGLVGTLSDVFARHAVVTGGFLISGRVEEAGHTVIAEITTLQVAGNLAMLSNIESIASRYLNLPPEFQERTFFCADLVNTISEATGLGARLAEDRLWIEQSGFETSAVKDSIGVRGHDGPLNCVMLCAGLRQVTTMRESEKRLWERISAHVGAASRLRRAADGTPECADAVFSPTGKLQHLSSGADRSGVEDGFARRRHARKRDVAPEAALEIWQGLHDGRWSLVDYLDTDGKVFVLAVRNEPARDVASVLTDRQRAAVALAAIGYGNKQIAYSLGLAPTAIAMLLARARAATGLRTRVELVRSFKRSLATGA